MADLGSVGTIGVALAKVRVVTTFDTSPYARGSTSNVNVAVMFTPHLSPACMRQDAKEILTKSISGVVRDNADNLCVRSLRAYVRATGELVSQATSAADGTYTMLVPDAVEHDVVALDDAAGTVYNDLIARVTAA